MTQRALIPAAAPTVTAAGGYRCIAADPPWEERGAGKCKRGADRHYPLMSTPEIIATIAGAPEWKPAKSAHLWLWVTDNFLRDGLLVMDALGFRYMRALVWVKWDPARVIVAALREAAGVLEGGDPLALLRLVRRALQIGIGQYLRGSHELCLLGVRGRAAVPPPDRRRPSVIVAPRGRHSEKPDEAFEVFEAVSPGPRVEFFARAPRAGWDAFGNDPALGKAGSA